jgi:hypothetical protein
VIVEHYTLEELQRLAEGSSSLRHWAASEFVKKSRAADLKKRNFDPGVGEHGTDRDKIPGENFAGPHRSFPITSPGDVSDAAHLVGHADNPGNVKNRIKNLARKKGQAYVDQLPASWKKGKGKKQAKKIAKVLESQMLDTLRHGGYDEKKALEAELTKDWAKKKE